MPRTALRLIVGLLCALLLVTSTSGVAEARKKKGGSTKVFGITRVAADWPGARIKVKWKAVRGATYQMRAATSSNGLSAAKPITSRTAGGTWTGRLDRARPVYVQVRAVRSGKAGPWASRTIPFPQGWPQKPTSFQTRTGAAEGQVQFSWSYTPYVSQYRPVPNAAWFGNWPAAAPGAPGWLPEGARSATYTVPARPGVGDQLMAVDYGNAVYSRLEARNQFHPKKPVSNSLTWRPAFPGPAVPQSGAPVHMASYNVANNPEGTRAAQVAQNIRRFSDVDVVALQEANNDSRDALVRNLGGQWRSGSFDRSTGIAQQVLYRADRYTLLAQGTLRYADGGSGLVPWVKLQPTAGGPAFYVGSVHIAEPGGDQVAKNRSTGQSAAVILDKLPQDAPFILAGDLRYGREPFGTTESALPAQPTLVRGGFYDAQAAQQRVGVQFSTLNNEGGRNQAQQQAHPSGVAARSDHILVKGFRGALRYENAANWSADGSDSGVPSDHNLILADLMVPS